MKRKVIEGELHHIYQKTRGGVLLFYSLRDYLVYFTIYCTLADKMDVTVLALCPMPDHLHSACPGSDQGQGRELTGGSYHTQGHQEGLEPGHAHFPGGNAQSKGNGEIAHADRDPVPQASGEPGSARHGLGCFFHIYSHLFFSECLPFRPSDGEKADSVF